MNSFIRFRSLGEDFTEENLKKVIAGEKESPERNEKVPDRKEAKPEKRKFDLVVDIQEKMAQGKNGGYVQWAKKYNVKQFAESILFLQQHDIHDKETLDALVDGSSVKYHELMKTIKDAEEKMAANKVIKSHIINYAKTRETYIAYRKSGYSKKFYEAHRDEITLHKAAKEAFSKLPDGKIPKVKDLNEEFARLLSEKKAAYSECEAEKKQAYFIVKDDIQELFKADFSYMLESGMTSLEDLSNLFAVYYFYYISQTSVILDQFCTGKRDSKVTLYYALDWEKVSKNRQCCSRYDNYE